MGCFLACFGFSKKRKRRVHSNKKHGSYKPLDSSFPVNLDIKEDPICSDSGFRDKPKEQSSFKIRKKVSFNLNVQTYEPIPTDYSLLESDEEGEKGKKGEETAKQGLIPSFSKWHSTALTTGAYPSNYRYQNCTYNYDDEDELEFEEIDLDDDDYENDIDDYNDSDDNEDYGNNGIHHDESQEEDSGQLESSNMESQERVSLTRLAKDKINVNPPSASNARDRSQYVHSVLNPIENLSQWKAVKAKAAPPKHQRKENIELKEEPLIFISSKPILDPLPFPNPSQSKRGAPTRPNKLISANSPRSAQFGYKIVSGLGFDPTSFSGRGGGDSELYKSVRVAWEIGGKVWEEIRVGKEETKETENRVSEPCPNSVAINGSEFLTRNKVMVLPCGLTLGSYVSLVGKPREAHAEQDPKIALLRDEEESVMVSQFLVELQGLKTVDGEDPPRVFHFNPRLRGDWSGKPVIELNTCYRMQWGTASRCEGWKSKADEETVDGQVKCEKWIRDDDSRSEESKATWWLNRLIGKTKKVTVDLPFPFSEGNHFVLTISAGLEGYHVDVGGRHITSFPYRTGFTLEDATGLSVSGDVDIHSVFAASLPSSHPSFAPQRHLDFSSRWKAPPLPDKHVELFVGILSAGNHFAERMAVRKSWMQHNLIKSSNVVARFFVALHARKEVNVELKKEAEYFGDIVIVPYMDNYDLVVLKTVAICEYGVRTVSAKYIMKCDDDTFVRVDAALNEAKKVSEGRSLYIGNINYYHKPLRYGKWAVTYEEWPEEDYPPYANGPGYVLSSDIAHFIVSEFEKHKLRLFKMEDVSMGMWVEQFNSTKPVVYQHSLKFCQFGCIEDYYTAHYQSPRQMICMWDKLLLHGKPQCCNMR